MGKTKVIRFAKQGGTAEYYPSLCAIHEGGFFIQKFVLYTKFYGFLTMCTV
ncbi:hypothetical protein HMPREF3232_00813 [Fannyhessea vaginae]|nr:hypothetical protein HMPREF3232_00813 [Fannyhessea vaginae]